MVATTSGNQVYDAHVPAANTQAVATLPASSGRTRTGQERILAEAVYWSYSAAPTGGSLVISNGTQSITVYISSAGPGFLPLEGFAAPVGANMTATLAAGGAGISGTVNFIGSYSTTDAVE